MKTTSTSTAFGRSRPAAGLQTRYDLEIAKDEIAAKVERDVQPLETVAARQ
jgi:hypothetical protein